MQSTRVTYYVFCDYVVVSGHRNIMLIKRLGLAVSAVVAFLMKKGKSNTKTSSLRRN